MGVVLGIHGPAGAGKDTMADYLIREFGWHAKLSFAGNLKEMCKEVFDLTDFDVYHQEGKKAYFSTPVEFELDHLLDIISWMSHTHPDTHRDITKVLGLLGTPLVNPRQILQFVGTDICRTLVSTYHSDVLVNKITSNADNWFVVTDVRFPNEGDLILDNLGGMVVHLKAPEEDDDDDEGEHEDNSVAENIDRQHLSETAMESWGRFTDIIENKRKGINFLYEEVNQFLERNKLCQDTGAETTVT